MSFSPRDMIPILMIIASIWSFFGLIQPRYETIKSLQAEKEQYNDTLKKADDAHHIRESRLADYNSVSPEDWEKLGKMLPNKADGVQLARDMDGLAKMFNIKLKGFSFSEEKSSPIVGNSGGIPIPVDSDTTDRGVADSVSPIQIPGIQQQQTTQLKKLKLDFEFDATYPDFMRFLRELERSLELSDVRSISFSRAGTASTSQDGEVEETGPNLYNVSLSIDTYWIE